MTVGESRAGKFKSFGPMDPSGNYSVRCFKSPRQREGMRNWLLISIFKKSLILFHSEPPAHRRCLLRVLQMPSTIQRCEMHFFSLKERYENIEHMKKKV